MTQTGTWHAGRIMDVATGYWKSAVLQAAVELGVFEALDDDPGADVQNLADRLNVHASYLADLLDALTAMEMLVKNQCAYALHPEIRPYLSRHGNACMLDALRFNSDLYPLWGRLAHTVREGQPAIPSGAHLGHDPERTRRFAMGMHSRALALAPLILPALDPGNAATLLDIAAGPGTFSRMLTERHPTLRVTQFELPSVQHVAKELTRESVAAERITFHSGDYHTDPFPDGPFDYALLCGAIHQESTADAITLFGKIHSALGPGGRFLLVDLMLDENRVHPLFSNLFSINMRLTSPSGFVHTADSLTNCLIEARFINISTDKKRCAPYWIIEAFAA
jgi:SAM-dependent methyltransferase